VAVLAGVDGDLRRVGVRIGCHGSAYPSADPNSFVRATGGVGGPRTGAVLSQSTASEAPGFGTATGAAAGDRVTRGNGTTPRSRYNEILSPPC
jgi:hypothetical protein